MVHGLITDMGGTVSVQSPRGEGATFEIRLPRRKVAAWMQADPDLDSGLADELDDLMAGETD